MADGDTLTAPERAASAMDLELLFYGLPVRVRGDWPEVLDELRLDFWWFVRPSEAPAGDAVEIVVERRAPDFDAYGAVTASFVTPRNVVYQQPDRTLVDYFGRALSVVERDRDRALVQGLDRHLVHEAVYHFILSRVGRHLDARGLPRLHSLALSGGDGAVAVMLPSGGGKSTLALRALQDDRVRILSEDTALIDRRGRLHPFPLRMAINTTDAARVPPEQVRRIERMEFHPKLALEPGFVADRFDDSPRPLRHLVIGRRSLGRDAGLVRIPRRAAVGTLFREGVVGVGVYQGMEFILQHGMRDVVGKTGIVATRMACCGAGLARAKVWELTLGRDHERNWDAVAQLLR
ncbi:MAG: hypothetical protein QOJ14_2055 [Thermoleophilaceae bacterium]|nr:hypothetical protein [Thermoleophilaceae bacterium]